MNVVLAAGGRPIAQRAGHVLDHLHHVAPRGRLALRRAERRQRRRGHHRPTPGAQILGRELFARRRAQVVVHVTGADALPLPILIVVLEQFVAGNVAALADDARQAAVAHVDGVLLAALADELEADGRPLDLHVLVAQRRQAVGAVGAGVLDVADANVGQLHQPQHRGQHLVARQTAAGQVGVDALAQPRQRRAELGQAVVLGLVAGGAPLRVVAVLLAPPRVAAGGLQVAVGARADPHLDPGGRDAQRLDAGHDTRPDRFAAGVQVGEALPIGRRFAPQARLGVADVAQADGPRRFERVGNGEVAVAIGRRVAHGGEV